MEKMKKAPALRFPGFEGEWISYNLGDVGTFSKGKGVSKADIAHDGNLECIRYGELYTHYGETISTIRSKSRLTSKECVLSEANDVIIPASGESQLDIARASCVLKSGVALGGDLNIIRSPIDGVFLSYYLNNKKKHEIAALAQGISVVHLYSSQLKTLNLNLPIRKEQEKIASFLAAIDDKIQQLQKKKSFHEHYKKGVMQQIFNQKIRFGDDGGKDYPASERKKLGKIATFRRGSFPQPYGLSKWYDPDGAPFIQVYDVDDNMLLKTKTKSRISEAATLYSVFAPKGTLIITIQGSIGRIAKMQYDAYVDRTLLIFQSYRVPINVDYFKYVVFLLFEIEKTKAPGGTIKTITKEVLTDFVVPIACYEEQTKIANFLSAMDDKINLVNQQLEKTKQFKRGLLQQMFV